MSTLKPRYDANAVVNPYLDALLEHQRQFSHSDQPHDWRNVESQILGLLRARDALEKALLDAGRCLVLGGFDVNLRH